MDGRTLLRGAAGPSPPRGAGEEGGDEHANASDPTPPLGDGEPPAFLSLLPSRSEGEVPEAPPEAAEAALKPEGEARGVDREKRVVGEGAHLLSKAGSGRCLASPGAKENGPHSWVE